MSTALAAIRQRLAKLADIRNHYLAYQQDRVDELDHHGAWDAATNLTETEAEIAGLRFAEEAILSGGENGLVAEDGWEQKEQP